MHGNIYYISPFILICFTCAKGLKVRFNPVNETVIFNLQNAA